METLLKYFSRFALSVGSNTRAWTAKPYTQLLVASDMAGWSLDEDARELISVAQNLYIPSYLTHKPRSNLRQCVHYTSFFSLIDPQIFQTQHRISVDFYHGKPGQDPTFSAVHQSLRAHCHRVHKVRLSYSAMRPLILEANIPSERIHLIPIGINPAYFRQQTPDLKKARREELGIPQSAVVIGSFQKDGQGWGEGLEPKWVKGPDVFLETAKRLKEKIPELFVLLTGPARGFMKQGLAKAGIPFQHHFPHHYADLGKYYEALDCYVVSSREEGGPKAVLESMISGIPLISTNVGQAQDIVLHEKNGMVADVGDAEALAGHTLRVLGESDLRTRLITEGLSTAEKNTLQSQRPLWKSFFTDYIELS